MGQVQLNVNGRKYRVVCGDDEEARLGELARHLDEKIAKVIDEFGHVGEARLILLAALLITDELFEARMAATTSAAEVLREIAEQAGPLDMASSPNPGLGDDALGPELEEAGLEEAKFENVEPPNVPDDVAAAGGKPPAKGSHSSLQTAIARQGSGSEASRKSRSA